jgi:hypothetical protein
MSEFKSSPVRENNSNSNSNEILSLDAEDQQDRIIILVAKEGTKYEIERKAVSMSELIKTTLEGGQKQTYTNIYTNQPVININCILKFNMDG